MLFFQQVLAKGGKKGKRSVLAERAVGGKTRQPNAMGGPGLDPGWNEPTTPRKM